MSYDSANTVLDIYTKDINQYHREISAVLNSTASLSTTA